MAAGPDSIMSAIVATGSRRPSHVKAMREGPGRRRVGEASSCVGAVGYWMGDWLGPGYEVGKYGMSKAERDRGRDFYW